MQEENSQGHPGHRKKIPTAWIALWSSVLGLAVVVNILMGVFGSYLDLFLGRGTAVLHTVQGTEKWDSQYYKADYPTPADLDKATQTTVRTIEAEGAVLLKNDGVLPLSASADHPAKITVLGRDSADPVFGGSGSGGVDTSTVVDFKKGLEQAHFVVNPTVWALLAQYTAFKPGTEQFGPPKIYEHKKAHIWMDHPEKSWYDTGEMPAAQYNSVVPSFASYGDAAVVMFGRGGGEGGDLARDMKGSDPHYQPGQHQLQLDQDERDVLALAEKNFKKVVVLINASTPLELGPLAHDPRVDAVLWVGSPGQTGFNAVGDLLAGVVNPSGRTADIYPADFTKDPTFVNFGSFEYSNIDKSNSYDHAFFVRYAEGIYVGYRYYETAAKEGFLAYDQAVVYPFGYGLSYTTFDWKVGTPTFGDSQGSLSLPVTVTNTGKLPGKDVVQLYYSAPYTKGGIEKSEVVLGDFAKTKALAPGESQTLTLGLPVEAMASYDYKKQKAYVLDAGKYELRLQTDSHHLKAGLAPLVYTVPQTIVYSGAHHRASDKVAVTNQFDAVSAAFTDQPQPGKATNFSRADFGGTFPQAPSGPDFVASPASLQAFQVYHPQNHPVANATTPTTGAKNGLSLIDLRGKAFDDPLWDKLLDQLTPDEIDSVVTDSAYKTAAIASTGKPATVDLDGPAGISSWLGKKFHGIAYTSEVVVASTFNTEVAKAMGTTIGNEALSLKVNGWYGPAMNTHRSPFAGRNFEYYSEDGLLSGKLAAAVVSGAADKGVYAFIKHFALNDQETNRTNNGVDTWANEQAIREIYLKPYEIAVKTARSTEKYIADDHGTLVEKPVAATTAVMSSFNRIGSTWAGGNPALLQNVLRGEWGFRGMVISDFNLYPYMAADQGIRNGTDLYITFKATKALEDKSSPSAVTALRTSAHDFLYTMANSNALNGLVPGTTVSYTTAPWVVWLLVADGVLVVLGAGAVVAWSRRRE